MGNVSKCKMCFMFLSLFLAIAASFIWSGVGWATENPAGTTINDTLVGDPHCINNGTIETDENGEYGMKPGDGGTASNFGTVITHGITSHGIYIGVFDATATNWGTITTYGNSAYGMCATHGSTATNESGGIINTYDTAADGIFAIGYDDLSSQATNKGIINTKYATGIEAYYSTVTNEGTITAGGYGIYAGGGSTATNKGIIITNDRAGIYARGGSMVTNEGRITTANSYGIYAEDSSTATNKGIITTDGYATPGMYALSGSTVMNESEGNITTNGLNVHGMYAKYAYGLGSTATNKGTITTNGYAAYGMYASGTGSTATNVAGGEIFTYGDSACGMYAEGGATATNFGTVITSGNYAEGMYVSYSGFKATNESGGTITTYGSYAYGMFAEGGATATNSGTIATGDADDPNKGNQAFGMYGDNSTITNSGSITTHGNGAHGMYAYEDTMVTNSGSIITNRNASSGMYAYGSGSTVTNESGGTITTYGNDAHGMRADGGSTIANKGTITIRGIDAHGMQAANNSIIENDGSITAEGLRGHGIYVANDSTGTNSGSITVTGEGAHAVCVYNNSTFTNSGTLDSLHGNAITSVNSTVNLNDGTKLVNSHVIQGDDTSTLNVEMSEDLSAVAKGFGTFNKNGTGTLTLEGGSSAGTTNNNAGTLKIAPDTTFETNSYTQTAEASLHLYVPSNPDVGPPLKINNEGGTAAQFAGNIIIDYSSQPLPGMYKYIYVAGEKTGNFNSVSFVNPGGIYLEEEPQWVQGNSWSYVGNVATTGSSGTDGHIYVGYSFSEQALGLVSAIEDWSLLRWIMANHVQDVTSNIHDLKIGQKEYYAHFFANNTDRNPSGKSPLGYESDTKGISFGFDKRTDDKTVWGIYAGYAEKDIDFTDVVPASSDWEEQDSWHIGAYMSKRFDKWIISDSLTYRTTDHDSFRRQKDGDARASFDSWAVTNDIRAGYMVKEIGKDSHWEIVPEIGLNIGYFNRDGYSETNGYTYGDYDTTITEGVIGIRFRGEFISKDGTRFSPYLRLSYVNVLSGDDVTMDETRYGQTRWFTEELDDDYFVADLGMTLYSAGNFDMSLSYNGRFGDNTDSHGGWLRLEWKK